MKDGRKPKSATAVEQQVVAELMELRQKVAALEASAAEHACAVRRNRALYELSPEGIVTVGLDGRITECNQACAEMLGYGREELAGQKYQDLMPVQWHDFYERIRQEVMERGHSYEYEKEYVKKDGTVFPVSLRTWRIDDESGNPIGIWSIARDIAKRKQGEKELRHYSERLEELVEDKSRTLRESGENFRSLAESANDGILICVMADGSHVYANKRAAEITGYSVDELLKTRIKDLTHPDEFKKVLSRYRKRLAGENVPGHYETIFKRKDGEDVPIELAAARTTWHGQPAVLAIIRDITERVRIEAVRAQAEEALRESEERYRAIFEQAADSIILIDAQTGALVEFNDKAHENLGYSREEFEKLKIPDFEIIESPEQVAVHLEQVVKEGTGTFETRHRRKDGEIREILVSARAISVRGRNFIQSIWRDITERKKAEERLTKINECFVNFGPDPLENINRLTALCGETLGATCALYNRLDGEMLCSRGQWNAPPGYNPVDRPEGHICYDVIQQGRNQALIVRNLPETPYAQTDPNVAPYGLQTYIGWPVKFGDAYVGSLCVVYQRDFVPSETDEKFMEIIASAIGVEEERRRAEEALRESEETYRTLVETGPESVTVTNLEGQITYVSRRTTELHRSRSAEELLGENALDLIAPEDRERALANLRRTLEEGVVRNIEYTMLRKDGSRFIGALNAALLKDAQGNPKAFIAAVRDITERKQAEEALELKVAHLAALSQASQAVTASLELDQVLAEIVSLAGQVATSYYTTVILMDESGSLGQGAENLPGVPALKYRIRPGGLTNWIVRQRQAVIVDEIKDGIMTPKLGKGAPRAANPHIVEAGVKSTAGLPLIVKDRLLGVLYLHSLTPGAFRDQLPLLTAFASQAAVALENARLYGAIQRELTERKQAEEELRQYATRLDIMHTIEEAILAAQSPEETAQAVLSRIQQLVPCQQANVAVFDPQACEATILAGTPAASANLETGTHIPLAPFGNIIETLQRGETYLINDLLTYPQPPPVMQAQQAAGVRAYACVPLTVQGELIGALSLSANTTGRFGEEQVEIAHELANQLAIALQQARLHEQIQRHAEELEQRVAERTRDLERRTAQLQVAAEVARDAVTAHNLDDLLSSAVDLVRERFGYYHAGIFLLDRPGEYAVLRAATGEAGRQMLEAEHKLKVGEVGIVGYVTGSGRSRVSLDVGADAVHFENPSLSRTRSEMALPLKVGGRVIGALDVQSIHEAAFDEDDVATLQIMADQLAVAIERTQLFEQTQATLEQRLRAVISNAPIVLFALDREGMFTLSEGKGLEALGFEPGEHVGRSIMDVYHDVPDVLENIQRAFTGETILTTMPVRDAIFDIWSSPTYESGEVTGIIGVATDVTERKRAEEALRKSEEKYRLVSENIPVTVYSALPDEYSTNIFLSGRMEELTGYPPEQFLREPQLWTTIVHPDDREYVWGKIEEHRKNKCSLEAEYRIVTKDGTIKWVKDRATPMIDEKGEILRIDGFMEDITERKHLEDQMRLQERLAAVGQLAGGIAHDFNNFLTTIMLYAQILLRKSGLPSELAPVAETILEESRRAAQLVRRVLDFSRRSLIETRPVDISSCIKETADILKRTLPANIQLLLDAGPEEYIVNADRARIQQVVMNLALNARDAMPDGGELRIGLSRIEIKTGDEPPVAEMRRGEWICLAISDTGTGMTDEVRSHLFEPFFTTKGPKGTGLGLAQVYGVVKRHDGHIRVETGVGQGTTFRIYLTPHEATKLPESQIPPLILPQGQGEIILLAEDEDRVREAGREVLESLGYRVLIAADGREAMQVYRSAERVDLVLTDLVMPEMGGKELAQELKKIAPHVKVLAITGYTLVENMEELKQAGVSDVVHKPFEVETLAKVIRQTLDAD
jgi:two-component system cell cycle sensor histidine kinase/response regulator CckA